MTIHVTPIPSTIELAEPAFQLGTTNTAGAAVTAVASNSTLLVYDATVPTTIAYSAAAAAGDSTTAAHRNHTHGMVGSEGVAKGYCVITNAAGAPATGSYNVASGTKNATGNYTMTWDVDFSSANYTCAAAVPSSDSRIAMISARAAGTVGVFTYNSNADESFEVSDAMIVAFGEQ